MPAARFIHILVAVLVCLTAASAQPEPSAPEASPTATSEPPPRPNVCDPTSDQPKPDHYRGSTSDTYTNLWGYACGNDAPMMKLLQSFDPIILNQVVSGTAAITVAGDIKSSFDSNAQTNQTVELKAPYRAVLTPQAIAELKRRQRVLIAAGVADFTAPPKGISTVASETGSTLSFRPWIFFGLGGLVVVFLFSRFRNRRRTGPDGYAEAEIGVPHARSFRWKRAGVPQAGFELTLKTTDHGPFKRNPTIEVTGDAVIMQGRRYRLSLFKGFLVRPGDRNIGTQLYFTYGDGSDFLGWWPHEYRNGKFFGEQAIQEMIAALNDRLREVREANAGDGPRPEHLRERRSSDF